MEEQIDRIASHLRAHPTVPADDSDLQSPMRDVFDDSLAVLLPPKHCAFAGCVWQLKWKPTYEAQRERVRERELIQHVWESRDEILRPAVELLPHCFASEERVAAVYNKAIAQKIQEGAPLASYSIDRKCLRKAAEAMQEDDVQSLICFFCVS